MWKSSLFYNSNSLEAVKKLRSCYKEKRNDVILYAFTIGQEQKYSPWASSTSAMYATNSSVKPVLTLNCIRTRKSSSHRIALSLNANRLPALSGSVIACTVPRHYSHAGQASLAVVMYNLQFDCVSAIRTQPNTQYVPCVEHVDFPFEAGRKIVHFDTRRHIHVACLAHLSLRHLSVYIRKQSRALSSPIILLPSDSDRNTYPLSKYL